jgi:hypothetical protein
MKSKTYTDLKEWVNADATQQLNEFVGFDTPEVAPIASTQAVDDVDSAAFAVDQPEILDKLNAYCGEIANHQYINPYYPLNALWKKLSMVGINFNLKEIMMTGDMGSTKVPLNRFGGRYGTLGGPEYISHDDGTGIPGGLSLVVSWTKTGGVYSLNVHIEHSAGAVGFGEAVKKPVVDTPYKNSWADQESKRDKTKVHPLGKEMYPGSVTLPGKYNAKGEKMEEGRSENSPLKGMHDFFDKRQDDREAKKAALAAKQKPVKKK